MADQKLPAVPCKATADELYPVLRNAWRVLVGEEPRRSSLLVLCAQFAHETGGGKACMCWNLGNIKWTPGCGTDYCEYETGEGAGAHRVVVPAGAPGSQFRAYRSIDDAAGDYLRMLRGQFGFAWPAVEAGDTADFARRLKARGYYTDTVEDYAAGLARWYKVIDGEIGPDTDPAVPAAIARVQPTPGTDDDEQPTPPEDVDPAT